ncbi:MAG: DUF115 domain-containing protein [Spirochaetia bacterium]|nr:DUF115 domain-containing protein [Spirochaetia bacterium]
MNHKLYEANLDFLFSNQRIASVNENNLGFLKQPDQAWINNLANIQQNEFEKNGIRYHSARDPQREAQRQIQNVKDKNKRHIVFLGAGLGYPLVEALNDLTIESILVIETDAEIMYYCLALNQLYNTQKDIYFYFCPEPDLDSLENILPFFQNKNLDKIAVYNHRPSFQIPGSKFIPLEKQLGAIMYKRAINQATIIKFQGVWNKNIALNIKSLVNGKTLNALIEELQGKARNIVLCGAGPSLSESYPDLIHFRNRYLLICADTAFIPLIKNNIVPDVVISADPQWLNHYFAMSPLAAKSIWLMDPVVCYQSSHYLNRINARVYWWDNPFYLDQVIRDFKSRGEIAHGGSVSTNGFDLALKLKPETITLIGQDLSFSSKTAHVKGAVLESMVFYKNNRFHGFEMHNLRQMKSLPPRKVKQCIDKNDILFTNDKMQVFIDWFENQMMINKANAEIRFYNATRRGVLLNGFTHSTLSEIFIHDSEESFDDIIKSVKFVNDQKNISIDLIKNKFNKLQSDCLKLEVLYRNNSNLSRKAQNLQNSTQRNEVIKELDRNDSQIKKYAEVNKIISINAQSAILKITEHGDDSVNSGYLLYNSMSLSARKLIYFFKKMLKIIQ